MRFLVIFLFMFALPSSSFAGQLENGKAAYDRKDYESAFSILKPLAEKGNVAAESYLARMYEYGQGLKRDAGEAFKWWIKAAIQGDAYAQVNVGLAYVDGVVVKKDFIEAEKWFRKSAVQDFAPGEANLAELFFVGGPGVKPDHKESAKWFYESAQHGMRYSQFRLGEMFRTGDGVDKDYKKAYFWLLLGDAPDDSSESFAQLEAVRSDAAIHLSADERMKIEKDVSEWKAKPAKVHAKIKAPELSGQK